MGVGCHSLLQGLNLGLLNCRQILYCLSHQGSPNISTLFSKPSNDFLSHKSNSKSRCDSQGYAESSHGCSLAPSLHSPLAHSASAPSISLKGCPLLMPFALTVPFAREFPSVKPYLIIRHLLLLMSISLTSYIFLHCISCYLTLFIHFCCLYEIVTLTKRVAFFFTAICMCVYIYIAPRTGTEPLCPQ